MIGLTTDQRTTITIPGTEGPVFVCRYISARTNIKVQSLVESAIKNEQELKLEAATNDTVKVLEVFIESFDGIPQAKTVADLADVLTFNEIWLLIGEARKAQHISREDKKKSDSQSQPVGA
jgi:hypothetical protein